MKVQIYGELRKIYMKKKEIRFVIFGFYIKFGETFNQTHLTTYSPKTIIFRLRNIQPNPLNNFIS